MLRSGTGVVWSVTRKSSFVRFVSIRQVCDTKPSIGGFRNDWLDHPGTGCASARPSSAEGT